MPPGRTEVRKVTKSATGATPAKAAKSSAKKAVTKKGTQPGAKAAAPPAELIAGKVDAAQARKAFQALAAYTERRADSQVSELPLGASGKDADHTVWLQVTVKELSAHRKVKPARIPLAHPLLDESSSVCLLTKDPQREYKDLLLEKNIVSVNRVVGVEKLKGKFRPFDARRELARAHDLFLADERIVPLLPKLCGSVFYKDRKFPVPVDLTNKKQLPQAIATAIASTYFVQNKGSCTAVKMGTLARHTPEELVENLRVALPQVVSKLPGKWANVQNIEVKTGRSAALPIWNCALRGEGDDVRWAAAGASAPAEES
ncbi:proteasome-interacting protein cic1 [Malassezia obtusa]|uniref:Proteasome-interacting protein cic1 n=1 Tax=Malassezia obtusa TaxID=76774 RepID=A0AAF0ISC2_9BASI|nr:proteasome-interacting protein cic1 [Malassezia obtusa]